MPPAIACSLIYAQAEEGRMLQQALRAATANIDAIAKSTSVVAEGAQTVSRECLGLARDRMERNLKQWERLVAPGHPYAGGRLGTKQDVQNLIGYMQDLFMGLDPLVAYSWACLSHCRAP
jgi:Phasin protein